MKKFETKKLNRRQYIWSFIDGYLSMFFLIFIGEIVFAPYGTADYTNGWFYICLITALIITFWFNYYSIRWLVKFIRNKEPMPE
ncbi:hypothetical protein ACFE6N_14740 [Pedobacter sp. BG31]|uniref:hypothetical protein n=1 Tax=Pedobacter sp. BG31 TaxID=3349697 RepID=UPI0035F2A96C